MKHMNIFKSKQKHYKKTLCTPTKNFRQHELSQNFRWCSENLSRKAKIHRKVVNIFRQTCFLRIFSENLVRIFPEPCILGNYSESSSEDA